MGRGNSGAALIENRGGVRASIVATPANDNRLIRYAQLEWKYQRQYEKARSDFNMSYGDYNSYNRQEQAARERSERDKLRKKKERAWKKTQEAERRMEAAKKRYDQARRVNRQYWQMGARESGRRDTLDAIRDGARSGAGIRTYGGKRAYRKYSERLARRRNNSIR